MQKELIELIVSDANTARKQISEIGVIANQAHLKANELEITVENINSQAQQVEQIAKQAEKLAQQGAKNWKDLLDALKAARRGRGVSGI